MRGKVLWLGLAALGVADWLVLNLAVGPAYLASQGEEAPPAVAPPVVPTAPPEPVAMAVPPSTPQPPAASPSEESPVPEPAEPGTPPAPTVEAPVATPPPTVTPPAEQPLATAAPMDPLLFGRQSAELSDNDRKTLHRLAKQLRKDPGASVLIEGHADARGAEQFNEWLSQQRARAVRAYLQGLGVNPDQMQVASHGSNHPADGAGTDTAHAKNRRVELTVRSAR